MNQPLTIIARYEDPEYLKPVPERILMPNGDCVPNPAWYRAPYEKRILIGRNARVEPVDDLHATCP